MKKYLILGLALFCLAACNNINKSSSESSETGNKDFLIGTWQSNIEDETVTLIFNEDGSGKMQIPSKRSTNMLDPNYEGYSITWTHNGTMAYLKAEGESEVAPMKILSLDKKSLVFQFIDKRGRPDDICYFVKIKE